VWAWDDEEVAALREAFRRSQESSDSRGYGHIASLLGGHGRVQAVCELVELALDRRRRGLEDRGL
jgi:diphthamide synthase subunit DPH2